MKKMKRNHEAQMPLLEIIMVTGIFIVISGFLLQMFVSANKLEQNAKVLSQAVLCAENIAEEIKASKNLSSAMESLSMEQTESTYQGTVDSLSVIITWTKAADAEAEELSGSLVREALIRIEDKNGQEIFELPVTWQETLF